MRTRHVTDPKELEAIIARCQWCHVAMTGTDGLPYVIPMNFGYREGVIYLHGSAKGKKIDSLRQRPEVCVNFSADHLLRYQSEDVACSWSMKYRSVLCHGKAEFITDPDEKCRILDIIMGQYSNREFKYNPPAIREVCVFRVPVERMEGRVFGY